jgi:hypothetical protein
VWNPLRRLSRRTRLLAAIAIAVVVVAAVAVPVVAHLRHRTPLQEAMAMAPGDAQRYGFTDWSQVDHPHDPSATIASGIADLTGTLQRSFGFTPTQLEWELLVGNPETANSGQVDLLRFPDSFDVASLAGRLRGLGFTAPSTPTGVWGGLNATTATAGSLFDAVALDPSHHLVRLSDSTSYLATVLDGGHDAALPGEISAAAKALGGDTASAEVYAGSYLCSALSLGTLDTDSEAEGRQLVARAGTINPVLAFGIAQTGSGDVLASMTFADHDQAKANADARSQLAVGPAVGQSDQSFTTMFHLGRVTADGPVVTMRLEPREHQLLGDLLSGGPILFATC